MVQYVGTSTGTGSITTIDHWNYWNQTYATNSTLTIPTWESWNTAWTSTTPIYNLVQPNPVAYIPQPVVPVRPQPDRLEARDRSKELLKSLLSEQQLKDMQENHWFEVRSNLGNRYRIRTSSKAGNVDLMPAEGEIRVATFCAHLYDGEPLYDSHIAQKFALETDEEDFLRTANRQYFRAA